MHVRFLSRLNGLNLHLRNPDNGGTAPAGGTGGQGSDPADGLRAALARHNQDATALATQLYGENYQLRERNRQLTAQVPAEGSVALPRADAEALTAYRALGDAPTLAQQLQAAQATSTELASLKRAGVIRDVAEVAGYKASVLGQLPGAADLSFEIRDVTVDGKAGKAVFVKPKEGAEVALDTYAKQHWGDFLPALQASTQQTPGQPAPRVAFPGQTPSGGTPPANPAEAFAKRMAEQRAAAPNPLAPRKATPTP